MSIDNRRGRQAGQGEESKNVPPTDEGRVRERNFDVLQTHLPDVFALVDHDAEPDYRRSTIKGARRTGNVYYARAETIKQLQAAQKDPRKDLVKIAAVDYPGFRGYRDLQAGVEVQINPEREDVFDERLLDMSLGSKGPEYVHKKVTVTVELDPDRENVGRFVAGIRRHFARQGMLPEDINRVVKEVRTLRVDTEALQKKIASGEITLFSGAWIFGVTKWDVVPRTIPTTRELEEAEETVINPTASSKEDGLV